MKSIAIFGAMYFELKPLLRQLKIQKEWKEKETHIFEASWKDLSLYIVRTGVGKKNAQRGARRLLEKVTPELGLSIGLCGGVSKSVKVGQTIISTQMIDLSSGEQFNFSVDLPKNFTSAQLASSHQILGPEEKEKVRTQYPEVQVCDMETSGLAAVLSEKGIPCVSIRTVSDPWDWQFPPQEILLQKNHWLQLKMLYRFSRFRFPVEFCRLLKLGWRSHRAAKKNSKKTLKIISEFVDTWSLSL